MSVGSEPVLIVQSLVLALNAVQLAAVALPAWAHTLIAVLAIGLGAIVSRSQVSPAS